MSVFTEIEEKTDLMDPFYYLLKMERANKGLENNDHHKKQEEKWLLFKVGSYQCVVSIENNFEISSVSKITPLPWLKQWVLGLVAHHGKLFPMIDFGALLEQELTPRGVKNKILFVHNAYIQCCFMIERIIGIRTIIAEQQKEMATEKCPAIFQKWCTRVVVIDQTETFVLSFERLVEFFDLFQLNLEASEI